MRTIAVAASHGASNPATWWLPLADWSKVQAEAVAWLHVRDGRCPYHATLIGAIAINAMQRRGDADLVQVQP